MCMWLAFRATTNYMYKKHMYELKKVSSLINTSIIYVNHFSYQIDDIFCVCLSLQLSKKCYDWLLEKPKAQWTRSDFGMICKYDQFVNNQCEVFNNSIKKYRDLPIISMLKAIHIDVQDLE